MVWDVIVVGGGISGLAAADALVERGWRVLLLERERQLGGRIRTIRAERLPLEMGPSYVGPTQGRMQALVRRFGLGIKENDFDDDKLSVNHFDLGLGRPLRTTFQGTHTAVPEIDRAIAVLDKLTAQVAANLERPWELYELRGYDTVTVEEWSDQVLTERHYGGFAFVMRRLLAVFVRSILSVEPSELSMLFFLYYCARCGGFRYMVSAVDYGPDSQRLREGFDTLVERLAQSIVQRGGIVQTGAVVEEIDDTGELARVRTAGGTFRAHRLIVAAPPAATLAIAYTRPLPEARRLLCERMRPGSTFKGYVVFDEPWFQRFRLLSWDRIRGSRLQLPQLESALRSGGTLSTLRSLGLAVPTGYTGYTNGDAYRVSWTMDGTWKDAAGRPTQPALMWFVVGEAARRFGELALADRRQAVLDDLEELFAGCRFPKAPAPRYYELDWTKPPHQAGPTSVMGPELLSLYGHALREPFGRIHWAGTETAVHWGGYMEGGVEAGRRAGREAHDALLAARHEPTSGRPQDPIASSVRPATLRCGAAKIRITPDESIAMAGYGWAGRVGRRGQDDLYARVMYLEDAGGRTLVLCSIDLHSASRRVLASVRLRAAASGIDPDAIVLAGTHTHTAPGHFYGNSFYDLFAQAPTGEELGGFHARFAESVALAIAQAIVEARSKAENARVGFGETLLWGVSRNRSLPAYLQNGDPPVDDESLSPQQRAVDPRLTALAAFAPDDRLIACFSLFGLHATALGAAWGTYHRDWPGFAVDAVERAHPGAVVAFAPSALGDATPLAPDDVETDVPPQGEALARRVGERVAGAMPAAIADARQKASDALRVEVRTGGWNPGRPFRIGWPVLGGSEDGRSSLYGQCVPGARIREGMVRPEEPDEHQRPKHVAMPVLHAALGGRVLEVADWHPLQCVRLGTLLLCTVPGEPTTMAARRIEARLQEALEGVEAVRVLACAGDYAGYFTTAAEYRVQHYEGAHTLYGHASLDSLIERLVAVATSGERPQLSWSSGDELAPEAARALSGAMTGWLSGSARGLFRLGDELVTAFATDVDAPEVHDEAGRRASGAWRLPLQPLERQGKRLWLATMPVVAGRGPERVALHEATERRGGDGAARVALEIDDRSLDDGR